MERMPKSGELYRHFKNKMYQIVTVANHSETGEKLVIYQALYGDYQTYARPLEMFVSEVDRAKYPEVKQRYRFELVEREEMQDESVKAKQTSAEAVRTVEQSIMTPVKRVRESINSEPSVNPKLMAFFDADELEEKYSILLSMRDEVDDRMINNMAVVLDVVIPEGDVSDRYEQLKNCIKTKQRYETDRLR